jgi:hypothetical protein
MRLLTKASAEAGITFRLDLSFFSGVRGHVKRGGQPTPLPFTNLAISNVEATVLIEFEPCSILPLPLQQEMWPKRGQITPCALPIWSETTPDEGHDLSCSRGTWRVYCRDMIA